MPDAPFPSEVDLAKLIEDINMLKRDIAAIAERSGEQVKSSAVDAASKISAEAQRLYDSVTTNSERSLEALSTEIEQRPLVSVLIAFALGYLGGRLMHRR